MADLSGKNLKFLSGTQANLDTLRTNGGATEGAFYLTNDTHRLYIGTTEDSKVIPVPVNEGVVTVASVSALPDTSTAIPGSFYFATAENVLCTYNGTKWVQINPDTTISKIVTNVVKDEKANNITINDTVTDSNGSTKPSSGYTLSPGAGITLTNDGNVITIGSSGTGGIEQTLETVQQEVGENEKSKYVNVNHKTVVKKPDGTEQSDNTQTVRIAGGDRVESVTADAENKIVTIQPTDQELSKLVFSNGENGEGFVLQATHKTTSNQVTSSVLNPSIKYGYNIDTDFSTITETGTEQDVKFNQGAADLDVFTAKQTSDLIDKRITAKLAVADAMTFCGVVASDANIPAITNCHNGDTYKVTGTITNTSGTITDTNGTIKVGDLLIAYGTEDKNTGLLTDGYFYHIPSGNEYVTETRKVTHGIEIIDDATTPTLLGGLILTAGNQITLTDDNDANNKDRTVTVAHGTITTTDPVKNDSTAYSTLTDNKRTKTITVIKSITTDNGHVTGITTADEVIEDTDVALKSLTNKVEQVTSGTEVKVTTSVQDKARDTAVEDTLNFKSSTITLTGGTKAVTMDLTWGSF